MDTNQLIVKTMHPSLITAIEDATAKALATTGPAGVNVVPVSMVRVVGTKIWLFDFFMEKTVVNIQAEAAVSLAAWAGMQGVQIKAAVTYTTSGPEFDEAVTWVGTQNPDRVVQGLLQLQPTACYDISPGGHFVPEELALP